MRSSVAASEMLRDRLGAIVAEFELPTAFPPELEADARRAATANPGIDLRGRTDVREIPFVTLDPATSIDLDQAFAIAADGPDLVLSYAIADVAAVIAEGSPLEAEAWRRGETVYLPHRRIPQYPTTLSEAAASLLPDGDRAAVVLTVAIGPDGTPTLRRAERAIVRSRSKLAYETTEPGDVPLLAEFARRAAECDARRGAQQAEPPEQEIVDDPTSPTGIGLQFRARSASERANAALSLSANMAVAALFVQRGVGLFRDLAEPDVREIASLRRVAAGFGIAWAPDESLRAMLTRLSAIDPRHAALQLAVRRAGGGARYRFYERAPDGTMAASTRPGRSPLGNAFTSLHGGRPAADVPLSTSPWHAAMAAPYAHATAPLRRLADRYVLDLAVLLSAGGFPDSASIDRLAALPATMERADSTAARIDRACLDLVEAVLLRDRVGEEFDAVVVDANKDGAAITIAEPAVRARLPHSDAEPGARVRVRLIGADPATRMVRFEPVR